MVLIQTFGVVMMAFLAAGGALAENRIDQVRPDAPILAQYGVQAIGVKTVKLTNPNQLDIENAKPGNEIKRYDRPLTVEVWYPAKKSQPNGDYKTFLRDGKTEVTLVGRAVRDAEPALGEQAYPLIILSHGYPGNRFLLSHLGENLASKGYVVASIDHTDSTYNDQGKFGSTLVNRSLDQRFVLTEMARLGRDKDSFLNGLVDTDHVGLIGYSMGGYGSVITAGAGVSEEAVNASWSAPSGALAVHKAGSQSHQELFDSRFKAIMAIAPWGMQRGMWKPDGLAEVKVPLFFIGGSVDDVSDYKNGIRPLFLSKMPVERYLLTFDNANHNAGAPMPAPEESWLNSESLGRAPFDHYADPVWDTVRMNNITQHFATAWFDLKLKGDQEKRAYLNLVEDSAKGLWAANEDGTFKPEHTYWKGFANRTAVGLHLERRPAD